MDENGYRVVGVFYGNGLVQVIRERKSTPNMRQCCFNRQACNLFSVYIGWRFGVTSMIQDGEDFLIGDAL